MTDNLQEQDILAQIEISEYQSKSFKDYLENNTNGKTTLVLTCNSNLDALKLSDEKLTIDSERCIGCLSCIIANSGVPHKVIIQRIPQIMISMFGSEDELRSIFEESKNYFQGVPASLPQFSKIFGRMCGGFEEFTAKNEVDGLAIWSMITLKFLSSDGKARVAKEIGITPEQRLRDARLDVCVMSNNRVAIAETKVSLVKMLADGRFPIQMRNYNQECRNSILQFNRDHDVSLDMDLFLIIGGKETDLFPPNDSRCTARTGNRSATFYQRIEKEGIRFVSANALWALAMKSLSDKRRICWDLLFPEIFSQGAIGLVSAGIVMKDGTGFAVRALDKKVLTESSIPFSS
jgi:hypothetical protein